MELHTDECFDILRLEKLDNTLVKQNSSASYYDETDSGICGSEYMSHIETSRNKNVNTPVIMINEDDIVDNIEIAAIESYYERILTPEGNVKYKNYRMLAPAPTQIRMYSPSGDIHTTPKKGKIVPKFDLFHDSLCPIDKMLSLIESKHMGSKELEDIIKPLGVSRRVLEIIRKTNKSSLEDRIEFLNSVLSPSPSSLSIMSEDSVFLERFKSPSPEVEKSIKTNLSMKSYSVDIDDLPVNDSKRNIIKRQTSFHTNEDSYIMNLSDELRFADNVCARSCTPRKMTDFEYYYFHRPVSSLSHRHINNSIDKHKPRESKKSIIRNFIQRNMIDRADHRDKLAKLALAIEEDTEPENIAFISSAKQIQDKISAMLDEVKLWKSELMEIQEDIQDDCRKVTFLIEDAKALLTELKATHYLDDIIDLLHGKLETVSKRDSWPFMGYVNGKRRNPETNLII